MMKVKGRRNEHLKNNLLHLGGDVPCSFLVGGFIVCRCTDQPIKTILEHVGFDFDTFLKGGDINE